MSKKRKLHQLIGTIKYCWAGTSKSRTYKNQPFYVLEIDEQSLFTKSWETINVFYNLVDKSLWNTLEQHAFKNQKYSFWCEKRTRGWRLKNCEEIKE